jgi:hypothetical protein
MSIKSWFQRAAQVMREALRGGRGIISALLRELPPVERLLAEDACWQEVLREFGDQVAAFEPADHKLLSMIRRLAQFAEFVAPFAGVGKAKELAVLERLREAWRKLDRADDTFDIWWAAVRPMLERYARRCKDADGWLTPPEPRP